MTAQSVQNVLSAGGATLESQEFADDCEKIFQEFDPPIVTGTYSSVSTARQEANKAQGDNSPFRNQQSEHMVANSSMQGSRGVNSSNIPGAAGYSEGTGFAYNVYDDQSAGTEHKWLTDTAKAYEEGLTRNPTLAERLEASKKWTKESLLRDDLVRSKDGVKRSRIKDKPGRTQQEKEALAEAAAKCLATKAEQQFTRQGVATSTETRRGLVGGSSPAPTGSAARRSTGV